MLQVANKQRRYSFVYLDQCNMCHAGLEEQKLLGRRLDSRQGLWPRRRSGIAVSIFYCRQCGLIFPNPMPLPESIAQHYDVEPEAYWAPDYFVVDPNYISHQIETFAKVSGRKPGGQALDVGAGIGKAMVALGRAGFEVSGIEPSPAFRRAAIERMGIAEDRVQLSSIEEATFPEDTFDFINFHAVLEHISDPALALQRMVKWLKPDGYMYVEVPSSAFMISTLMRLFYRMTGADYVINTCPMHVPYHLYEFGLESFVKAGQRDGYTVAFHEFYPCANYMPRPFIITANVIMNWTKTGMQLAVWLKKGR